MNIVSRIYTKVDMIRTFPIFLWVLLDKNKKYMKIVDVELRNNLHRQEVERKERIVNMIWLGLICIILTLIGSLF